MYLFLLSNFSYCCYPSISQEATYCQKVYLGSQLEGTVHQGKEGIAAGVWDPWSHYIHSPGERERDYYCCSVPTSFPCSCLIWDPNSVHYAVHIQCEYSFFNWGSSQHALGRLRTALDHKKWIKFEDYFFLLKIFILLFMCAFCLCLGVYVGVGSPETGVTGYCESPKIGTGNYSYSLWQQQALLTTEITLQFHALICCCCCCCCIFSI